MVMRDDVEEDGESDEALGEDVHFGRRSDVVCRNGEAWDGTKAWASHCMPRWLVLVVGEQVLVRSRTIAADISIMLELRFSMMLL